MVESPPWKTKTNRRNGRTDARWASSRSRSSCAKRASRATIAPGEVTHKLVKRAETGRRLTAHSKNLVLRAWNKATGENRPMSDLFSY